MVGPQMDLPPPLAPDGGNASIGEREGGWLRTQENRMAWKDCQLLLFLLCFLLGPPVAEHTSFSLLSLFCGPMSSPATVSRQLLTWLPLSPLLPPVLFLLCSVSVVLVTVPQGAKSELPVRGKALMSTASPVCGQVHLQM